MEMSMPEISDQTREAMYYASLKNRLVHPRVVTKTVYDNYTQEEFKQIMIDKSPVSIYNTQYSRTRPLFIITRLIMPSEGGVWGYFDSAADKTPKLIPWERFYKSLTISGLENIVF